MKMTHDERESRNRIIGAIVADFIECDPKIDNGSTVDIYLDTMRESLKISVSIVDKATKEVKTI